MTSPGSHQLPAVTLQHPERFADLHSISIAETRSYRSVAA